MSAGPGHRGRPGPRGVNLASRPVGRGRWRDIGGTMVDDQGPGDVLLPVRATERGIPKSNRDVGRTAWSTLRPGRYRGSIIGRGGRDPPIRCLGAGPGGQDDPAAWRAGQRVVRFPSTHERILHPRGRGAACRARVTHHTVAGISLAMPRCCSPQHCGRYAHPVRPGAHRGRRRRRLTRSRPVVTWRGGEPPHGDSSSSRSPSR